MIKKATFAISSGLPILFKEVLNYFFYNILWSIFTSYQYLLRPGAIAFTLIFKLPNSLDNTFDENLMLLLMKHIALLPIIPSIDDVDEI